MESQLRPDVARLSILKQRNHLFERFENVGAKIHDPLLIEGLSHCLGTRKQNAIHHNTLLSIVLVVWTGFAFFHFGYILESIGATFRKHYNTEVKEGQEKRPLSVGICILAEGGLIFFLSMSKRFTMKF